MRCEPALLVALGLGLCSACSLTPPGDEAPTFGDTGSPSGADSNWGGAATDTGDTQGDDVGSSSGEGDPASATAGGGDDDDPQDDGATPGTQDGGTQDGGTQDGGTQDGDTQDDGRSESDGGVVADEDATFFVTSVGAGDANLGGLAGADDHCRMLAEQAGLTAETWQAYLSTVVVAGVGGETVHARDRIGAGPWHNTMGQLVATDVDDLHDGGVAVDLALDEYGLLTPSEEHDILTGSDAAGFARETFPDNPAAPGPTCGNWTIGDSSAWAWVGHVDAEGPDTWNDAHPVQCDSASLAATLAARGENRSAA